MMLNVWKTQEKEKIQHSLGKILARYPFDKEVVSKIFTRRWHCGWPGHRGHGWGRAGDVDCWICRWWLLGVSGGLLGPIFSLVPSSSNRPVALWRAHSAPGVILAWVGGWVRAVLPEWSSGFWIFSSLNLSWMAVSSMPKMSVTLLRLLFRAALNFQTWSLYLVALLVKDGEVSLLQPAGIWKPNEHGFLHFAARIFSSMMGT